MNKPAMNGKRTMKWAPLLMLFWLSGFVLAGLAILRMAHWSGSLKWIGVICAGMVSATVVVVLFTLRSRIGNTVPRSAFDVMLGFLVAVITSMPVESAMIDRAIERGDALLARVEDYAKSHGEYPKGTESDYFADLNKRTPWGEEIAFLYEPPRIEACIYFTGLHGCRGICYLSNKHWMYDED